MDTRYTDGDTRYTDGDTRYTDEGTDRQADSSIPSKTFVLLRYKNKFPFHGMLADLHIHEPFSMKRWLHASAKSIDLGQPMKTKKGNNFLLSVNFLHITGPYHFKHSLVVKIKR